MHRRSDQQITKRHMALFSSFETRFDRPVSYSILQYFAVLQHFSSVCTLLNDVRFHEFECHSQQMVSRPHAAVN